MSTKDSGIRGAHFPPDQALFQDQRSGNHFATYDAYFENVLLGKFPSLASKAEHHLVSGQSLLWHERNLPKQDIAEYKPVLDTNLELAILTLIPITPMRSLDSLVNTLYGYLENRFMLNESVLVFHGGSWLGGRILEVTVDASAAETLDGDGTKFLPHCFDYSVEVSGGFNQSSSIEKKKCWDMRRPGGALSRDAIRAVCLMHCKCKEPRKGSSVWCLKDKIYDFYDLNNISWWDMFAGPEPRFSVSSKSSKHFPREEKFSTHSSDAGSAKKSQKNLLKLGKTSKFVLKEEKAAASKRKHEDSHVSPSGKKKKDDVSHHVESLKASGSKAKALSSEEKKIKAREYKKKWKEKMALEKAKIAKKWAEAFTVGEDMDAPSRRPLPVIPRRLHTMLPDGYIGDALFVLEFWRVFGGRFDPKTQIADLQTWNLSLLFEALVSESVDSPYTRLLCCYARAVISCIPAKYLEADGLSPSHFHNAWEQSAIRTMQAARLKLGMSFRHLPVIPSTVSEVIRMCLLVCSLSLRSYGPTEAKSDGVALRFLQSPAGKDIYKQIHSESVFSLSFDQRLQLIMLLTQCLMESDLIRGTLEDLSAAPDEGEKTLKNLKHLLEEMGKICTAKIANVAAKERPADKASEKGDRFRQLLEIYTRKRSDQVRDLRSDKPKSIQGIVDDIKVLGEGRRKRRLTDMDRQALSDAMADLHKKLGTMVSEEKTRLSESVFLRKQQMRLEPIGMDRHKYNYWFLPSFTGLLIEQSPESLPEPCCKGCLCEAVSRCTKGDANAISWWAISRDDIHTLSKNLLINGEREVALKKALEDHVATVVENLNEPQPLACVETTTEIEEYPRKHPVVNPEKAWRDQLIEYLRGILEALQSKLQKLKLGGFQPPEDQKWLESLRNPSDATYPTGQDSTRESYTKDQSVPSPEILAPVSVQKTPPQDLPEHMEGTRQSVSEQKEASDQKLTNGHSHLNNDDSMALDSNGLVEGDRDSMEHDQPSPSTEQKNLESTVEAQSDEMTTSTEFQGLIRSAIELTNSIRLRFMGAPLVTMNEQSAKDATQLEQWKASLSASGSLSQIGLHLAVLEHCILWGKAPVAGVCRHCKKRGESETLIMCDGCDRVYHLLCASLFESPKDSWFCAICKPPPAIPRTRRARHVNYSENGVVEPENYIANQALDVAPEKPRVSDRAARALQRSQMYMMDGASVHSGASSRSQSYDGPKRATRQKKVDYKGLLEGEDSVEDVEGNGMTEEDYEYANGDFHMENESQSGSEDSEYDPGASDADPKWGKKHKKHRLSRR